MLPSDIAKISSFNDPGGCKSSQEMKCMNHIFQPAKLVAVLPDSVFTELLYCHNISSLTRIFQGLMASDTSCSHFDFELYSC